MLRTHSNARRDPRLRLLALAALGWMVAALPAWATTVDLGDAADYGILTGQKESVTFAGNLALAGDLGLGSNATLKFTGSHNVISGSVYKDSGVSTSGSASITGGTVTQSMSSAINDAVTAANTATALAATPGLVDQGGSIGISKSSQSIVIKAVQNASENVLTISSLSLTNGSITFDSNGYTDAKFIINVTGGFTVGNAGVIKGINGVDASDIIFNIEDTGSTVNLTGNASTSIIGTILAPQRNVSLGGGGSLTGALIAGVKNSGSSYTLSGNSSGYNITGFAYKPPVGGGGGGHVPEPSSLLLYGSGIAALLWLGRRRLRA